MLKKIVLPAFAIFNFLALQTVAQVYVAGFENNTINSENISVARYWKDGTPISLTDGTKNAFCKSVCVAGDNVYIAGAITNTSEANSPVYWVNNSPVELPPTKGSAFAGSVAATDGIVCVSAESNGWTAIETDYWKNNTPVSLQQQKAVVSIKSVCIGTSGTVYAAGVHIEGSGDGFIYPVAAYWTDGKETLLADKKHESLAQSICTDGADIYIAGYETWIPENANHVSGYIATCWKNGKAIHLSEKTKTNYATSVFAANGDVYVAGYERQPDTGHDIAKYWKNGQEIRLTDGSFYGRANAIFVHQNDVYVAGEINPETDVMKLAASETGINKIAVYWKNGKQIALTDKKFDASASGIFVY